MTTLIAKFQFERETKGAVRFQEIDDTGKVLDMTAAAIGTLYLRKSSLDGQVPQSITVSIEA
jgi:hypothetical protein